MQNLQLIIEMLKLQQRLNDDTNGKGWEKGATKDGKIISWRRCIYMECAELIDSFAWKHWKAIAKPTDTENVIIEIVDIWHFIMSLGLEIYATNNLGGIENLAQNIAKNSAFEAFCGKFQNIEQFSIYEIIADIEKIIHRASGVGKGEFDDLLNDYFCLSLKCGVNLERLFAVYMGKNVLNKFRQDHGYKEGSYKKIWDGVEDNAVMGEILKQGASDPQKIYAELQKRYEMVK